MKRFGITPRFTASRRAGREYVTILVNLFRQDLAEQLKFT